MTQTWCCLGQDQALQGMEVALRDAEEGLVSALYMPHVIVGKPAVGLLMSSNMLVVVVVVGGVMVVLACAYTFSGFFPSSFPFTFQGGSGWDSKTKAETNRSS